MDFNGTSRFRHVFARNSTKLRGISPAFCVLCNVAEETLLHLISCSALGPPLTGPISRLIERASGGSAEVSKALQVPSNVCSLAIGHWPVENSKLLPVSTFVLRNRVIVLRACMKEFADRYRQRCRAVDNLRVSTTDTALKDVLLRLHGNSEYSNEGDDSDHGQDVDATNFPQPMDGSDSDSECAVSGDDDDESS